MASQPNSPTEASPKRLDQVRQVMRLRHCSSHTERAYLDWIKRYVHFHWIKKREDLAGGEAKIEAFLTHLEVKAMVAAATQNQAMNALVFLRDSNDPGAAGSRGRFHDDDLWDSISLGIQVADDGCRQVAHQAGRTFPGHPGHEVARQAGHRTIRRIGAIAAR